MTREYVDPNLDPEPESGFLQPDVEIELVRRASMIDDNFNENNKRVWLMLRAVTHKADAWQMQGFRIAGRHISPSSHISRGEGISGGLKLMQEMCWNGSFGRATAGVSHLILSCQDYKGHIMT